MEAVKREQVGEGTFTQFQRVILQILKLLLLLKVKELTRLKWAETANKYNSWFKTKQLDVSSTSSKFGNTLQSLEAFRAELKRDDAQVSNILCFRSLIERLLSLSFSLSLSLTLLGIPYRSNIHSIMKFLKLGDLYFI